MWPLSKHKHKYKYLKTENIVKITKTLITTSFYCQKCGKVRTLKKKIIVKD